MDWTTNLVISQNLKKKTGMGGGGFLKKLPKQNLKILLWEKT